MSLLCWSGESLAQRYLKDFQSREYLADYLAVFNNHATSNKSQDLGTRLLLDRDLVRHNNKQTGSSERMKVTEIGEFLRKPPAGFSVVALSSGYRVHSDPEKSLVLIDDLHSCRGNIVFHKSLGRKVKIHNLWEYSSFRKSLLSRRIYLLMSACEENFSLANRKEARNTRALKQYVVSIDGNDPFIKWQMEKGLDWTISSVAGESYRVDIDLTEALESWAAKNIHIATDDLIKVEPVWRDASFTLKYYSDALFDFPHWFGLSKRKFQLRLT